MIVANALRTVYSDVFDFCSVRSPQIMSGCETLLADAAAPKGPSLKRY